ncbi:glycosyltransferase family 2 protein [Sporolactobacillus spathodeae]|uniref:Glycosyltransferase involved in cell wall biosynthesis n=1 Tax=Sporolactobacillus spathodeae TaxID=1465502 RepID=A0ABS2Q791_9BACL|nr:glycosyltransferase [Sporolactobacillus spathodeae]MBM7657054.1 glycosyltransferase involved in cell wall biosynthesis [Sporolactobacillus spathodeae]
MEPLISVIVPVYKTEEYLDQCIESIVVQTYRNLEIILVDDGSPDRCPEICDDWAERDPRIRVIHKENAGASSARNTALDLANGDYLAFVDCDDWIHCDTYELLMNNLKVEHADLSICSEFQVFGKSIRRPEKKENVYLVMNSEEAFQRINSIGYFGVGVWDKLYAKHLFDHLRFPEGRICEDYMLTYTILDRARTIVYDATPKYYYRQRSGSLTHSTEIDLWSVESSEKMLTLVRKKYPSIETYALSGYLFARVGVYDLLLRTDAHEPKWKAFQKETRKLVRKNYSKLASFIELPTPRRLQLLFLGWFSLIYTPLFKLYYRWKNRSIH